jgi:hypothetical protein
MSKTDGVWILTSENNDYDQHGEYFRAVFAKKPSLKELATYFAERGSTSANVMEAVAFLEHVLAGGGRRGVENEWYNLEFVPFLGGS